MTPDSEPKVLIVDEDPTKAASPTDQVKEPGGELLVMTLEQFRKSVTRGILYVPRSRRPKNVARHKGESTLEMMKRLGAKA